MSNLILVFGATGQGKSTWVKNYIANSPCLVFDYQNEYTDLQMTDLTSAGITPRARMLPDAKNFVEGIKKRVNTAVVWEEATGFLIGRLKSELIQLVLSKRHTNNTFIFVFHAIHRTPSQLLEFANFIVVFPTLDQPKNVLDKTPYLMPAFQKQFLRRRENQTGYLEPIIYRR